MAAKHAQKTLFNESAEGVVHIAEAPAGVTVREVVCRSLINTCDIADYSFNPYTGCTNGCVYCYARFMSRFHPHDEAWGEFVDVKVNAADVLAKQLRKLKPGAVFTCSACDGWQHVEAHYHLTRRCCEMLLEAGFRLNVLTKSARVVQDFDVFERRNVRVGVTITTPDEREARAWEPRASSVSDRLEVLRAAKSRGLETVVMFGPLLPGISDTHDVLVQLFELARDVDVDRIWTDTLNRRPMVWPAVRAFLRGHRPDLLPLYKRVLFDKIYRATYERDIELRIAAAARETGMSKRMK